LLLWVGASAFAAAAEGRAFDIPARGTAQTLKTFAAQAGREIMFPADTLAGVKTEAVKARSPCAMRLADCSAAWFGPRSRSRATSARSSTSRIASTSAKPTAWITTINFVAVTFGVSGRF
jgi:hypothetical protein